MPPSLCAGTTPREVLDGTAPQPRELQQLYAELSGAVAGVEHVSSPSRVSARSAAGVIGWPAGMLHWILTGVAAGEAVHRCPTGRTFAAHAAQRPLHRLLLSLAAAWSASLLGLTLSAAS